MKNVSIFHDDTWLRDMEWLDCEITAAWRSHMFKSITMWLAVDVVKTKLKNTSQMYVLLFNVRRVRENTEI